MEKCCAQIKGFLRFQDRTRPHEFTISMVNPIKTHPTKSWNNQYDVVWSYLQATNIFLFNIEKAGKSDSFHLALNDLKTMQANFEE